MFSSITVTINPLSM